ncbi:MAG: GNAT family N-acetyltransferase [Deltaproteobacteria bacterium]|nr:GNAT family N-acetyltransferase [Deltaproteobacteria bacterium]
MQARPVRQNDLATICGFPRNAEELFHFFPKAEFPLTPERLQEAIDARSDSTVVDLDGDPIAFANFYRWNFQGRCSIGNVVVAPAARGRGVAVFLVRHMIDLAFSKHEASEISVSCFNANTSGLLLYAKLGFEPFAMEERRDGSGRRLALLHMHLNRTTQANTLAKQMET